MQVGTEHFETYNRTLKRILWAEFIDEQMRVARENRFRASIVDTPYAQMQSLLLAMEQMRSDTRK